MRVETDIFDTIRKDISLVLHEKADSDTQEASEFPQFSEQSEHDSPTGVNIVSWSQEPAGGPQRTLSATMRTKIDTDFHMRKAMRRITVSPSCGTFSVGNLLVVSFQTNRCHCGFALSAQNSESSGAFEKHPCKSMATAVKAVINGLTNGHTDTSTASTNNSGTKLAL